VRKNKVSEWERERERGKLLTWMECLSVKVGKCLIIFSHAGLVVEWQQQVS
jgi:hypothetical protein